MSNNQGISRRDFTRIAFGTVSSATIKLGIKPFAAAATTPHLPYELVLHDFDWIVDPYWSEREEFYFPTWKTVWEEVGSYSDEYVDSEDFDEIAENYGEEMAAELIELSPEYRFYRLLGIDDPTLRCFDYDWLERGNDPSSTTWWSAGVELYYKMPKEDTGAVGLSLEDCWTTGNTNCYAHIEPSNVDTLNDLLLQRGINVIVKKSWRELSEDFDVKGADTSWQADRD